MFKKAFAGLDYWLIGAVVLLSFVGIAAVGSASRIASGSDPSIFYSQILWVSIGLFLMVFAANVNLKALSEHWILIYILNIILLLSVFFVGTSRGVAARWLRIGGVGIQPSEFSKIIIIFCLAKFIDKKMCRVDNIRVGVSVIMLTALPFFIILKQPSLSAALVTAVIALSMIFAAGIRYSLVIKTAGAAVGAVIFTVKDLLREKPLIADKIFRGYQRDRVLAWIDPEKYSDTFYQTEKSLNAIGSGRLYGAGLFKGDLTRLGYLPEPHNDFIFSVIGEEMGFLGAMAVMGLLLFVIYRCIAAASSAEDSFERLLCVGAAAMLAFQTFVNIGVATGILPNTGMALPFVSYGGSSMVSSMAAAGIVLNVGKKRSKSIFERRLL